MKISEWVPGFHLHDVRTVASVYQTMPACPADAIPLIVRKYENPLSPDALPGAISLERHDILHILLGRGLTSQDEAFVIGFTMGAASDVLEWHIDRLAWVGMNEYPKPYTWTRIDVVALRLGFRHTQLETSVKRDLNTIELEKYLSATVSGLREMLGIDVPALLASYKEEKRLLPDTRTSRRLPSGEFVDGCLQVPS